MMNAKPFRVIEHWSSATEGGRPMLRGEVAFVAYCDGKDLVKLTRTTTKTEGSETDRVDSLRQMCMARRETASS